MTYSKTKGRIGEVERDGGNPNTDRRSQMATVLQDMKGEG